MPVTALPRGLHQFKTAYTTYQTVCFMSHISTVIVYFLKSNIVMKFQWCHRHWEGQIYAAYEKFALFKYIGLYGVLALYWTQYGTRAEMLQYNNSYKRILEMGQGGRVHQRTESVRSSFYRKSFYIQYIGKCSDVNRVCNSRRACLIA